MNDRFLIQRFQGWYVQDSHLNPPRLEQSRSLEGSFGHQPGADQGNVSA